MYIYNLNSKLPTVVLRTSTWYLVLLLNKVYYFMT